MGFTFKSFWMFWSPAPDTVLRVLRLERAILERRNQAYARRAAVLRIRMAATTSALEQVEQEIAEAYRQLPNDSQDSIDTIPRER